MQHYGAVFFGSRRPNLYFAAKVAYSDADASLSYIFKPIDLQDIEMTLLWWRLHVYFHVSYARLFSKCSEFMAAVTTEELFKSSRSPSVPDASRFPAIWNVAVKKGGRKQSKSVLALLMSFLMCPQVILMSSATITTNNNTHSALPNLKTESESRYWENIPPLLSD